MSEKLKDTLNLPETEFPMRAGLVEREPKWIAEWEQEDLYGAIQEKNKDGELFLLHDGPPFANGSIHIGTALNKILKDTILRYKSMKGYRTPYVPGWDCHGLPIEHKVSEQMRKKKEAKLEIPELRKKCDEFAREKMAVMREQFKRLGVLADWNNEYMTLDPGYEADVIRTLAKFVEKGLVYRSKKPIYWSIPCTTALAEAEIEYKDIVSPSVYVKFPLVDGEKLGIKGKAFMVIWTTTPWTLPSNMAVAVHERLNYQEVKVRDEVYIVAEDLAGKFVETCKLEGAELGKVHLGKDLEHMEARHPFIDRPSLVILADHVTTESGTGCVHTAPGHGPDDYVVAQKYNLEVYSPLNDYGKYINDGKVPERLVNKTVLSKNGKCPANDEVLAILEEEGMLLHHEDYEHSYPHCWRSKTPVIFRAMYQWFIGVDMDGTREKALKAIEEVEWEPSWGKNRILGSVAGRPDWCISRQRAWGVPIIAFFDEHGSALMDADVIRGVADKIEKEGTNIWFEWSAERLLEGVKLPKEFEGVTLTKGTDTQDVWLDSGSSHEAVLKKQGQLGFPADVYFEGSDQHRGWFQSSLWTSVVANEGKAPYKKVITHGFVVNEQKRKISKSDKDTKEVGEYIAKYGVDILRLWINSEEYRNDMPISEGILGHIVQSYRTIRNTLKFQLGNLYDFDIERDGVEIKDMPLVDRWAMHKLGEFVEEASVGYEAYEFHKVCQVVNRFCSVTLSATYHDILKDRLYTYAPDWKERRASQTVIYRTFEALVRIMAPILTFTANEAWGYFKDGKHVHLEDWPEVQEGWKDDEVLKEVEIIFGVRDRVNEQLEKMRQEKILGQSMDAAVEICGGVEEEEMKVLRRREKELAEFFIVSQVKLEDKAEKGLDVLVKKAEGLRCPRSWRWVSKLVNHETYGEVSERCLKALLEKYP